MNTLDPLLKEMAQCLKALGHPARLSIVRLVVQGPMEGTPAGEIQTRLDMPGSTLLDTGAVGLCTQAQADAVFLGERLAPVGRAPPSAAHSSSTKMMRSAPAARRWPADHRSSAPTTRRRRA